MAIKIRRGTDTDRIAVIFEEGEVIYTTDTKSFFIGDGVTAGGNQIGGTTAASLLKTTVHNATGATLTKGQVVYLSGNTGNKPNAVLAQANSEATSSKTIGLIILNISNNANGDIATDGLLSDLNTSAFVAGDLLWLSDSIAGGVTTIIPDTPNHAVFIGYVVRAHATQGSILIHIQNGYELNELHDVKITSVANGDGLIYDSTLGYWKNSNTVTTQGNTFNAANKLVQLDATAKLPAVDGSQLTNLPSFSPPNGLLKLASAISTTFQVVKDYLDNASVLFLNSRRIGIGKDTSVTTQSVAVVEVQDTNTSIVLKPNGTGGIIASVPDGTATGGNARGTNAVDLQQSRSNSANVASGNYSTIVGGNGCTASGQYSVSGGLGASASNYAGVTFGNSNGNNSYGGVVSGGQNNTGGNADYIFIGGGRFNNTTGAVNGVISGGISNTVSSGYSVISGGQSNTASTNTHATVVGGQSNTASGLHSISGGNSNISSGTSSISLGGQSNTASAIRSVSLGGFSNTSSLDYAVTIGGLACQATNAYAVAFGNRTRGYLLGQFSYSGGNFTTSVGECQQSILTSYKEASLTTTSTTVLSLDGTGTTNLIVPLGNNRAWNVTIDTIAVVTAITGTATGVSVGDCYRETKQLLFKRIGGTSSIVGTVDTSAIKSDSGMATASITISAGGSQQMAITFTAPTFAGGGSVTCRVVSKVSLVEVAY
jgi:hypothetical protein